MFSAQNVGVSFSSSSLNGSLYLAAPMLVHVIGHLFVKLLFYLGAMVAVLDNTGV